MYHACVVQSLLILLPALALALVMLIRPYLGERTITRLRVARSRRRDPRAALSLPRPRSRWQPSIRGGRLIAAALAGRAPPAAPAVCC
jgi:hypothetical protein